MSHTASGDRSERARLLDYVPWLMRDYLTNQGPSTGIVILLIGFLTLFPVMQGAAGQEVRLGDVPETIATRLLRAMVPSLVFLGTFFATNGIIANDRKLGTYRFLFAKPVSPLEYYSLTFVTYGAGLLAVTLVLIGAWSLAVRPMFPVELFGVVLVMYLAYGGIGFLLSAAWRFDWLSLVTVLLISNVAWAVWGDATGIRHWLLYLLPPVHRASDVYGIVTPEGDRNLPWRSIGWLAGYGFVAFLAGLIVLRKRPLGTS